MGRATEHIQILILPGLHDSPHGHWQREWQQSFGFKKVEFGDWDMPTLHGWIEKLEESVRSASSRVILVAHSLGCLAAVWWASQSRCTDAVAGALLVAPPDLDRCNCPGPLRDFRPMPTRELPFRSIVVGSRNDPYATFGATKKMAQRWGSQLIDCGEAGHINADTALGCWTEGVRLLGMLIPPETPAPSLDLNLARTFGPRPPESTLIPSP